MNKSDLSKQVAAATGNTQAVTAEIVSTLFDTMAGMLLAGEKITIHGFGTFTLTERAARLAVKPGTKERIQVPAKKAVKFTAGTGLKP